MNPYWPKSGSPYFARIALSAGTVISGAKGTEPPAAVGAIVPSSRMSLAAAPRAAYVWNCRDTLSTAIVVSIGPSDAVSPQIVDP